MESKARRGFTLTELMVAVLIMVIVIVATSKIFGTVGRVVGVGEAGAVIIQESAAIERQIRSDFERLSREGFFMIRCVAVPNDINVATGGPLLNPALTPQVFIRADQIIFFTQGVQSIETMFAGSGTSRKGQSAVSRVYYGHGFQVPGGSPVDLTNSPVVEAFDPTIVAGAPIVPWTRGARPQSRTLFGDTESPSDYGIATAGTVNVTQPPATDWLLARQAILLASDDDPFDANPNTNTFLSTGFGPDFISNRSAPSILHETIINGRVDAAAGELNAIRGALLADDDAPGDPGYGFVDDDWTVQRGMISTALFYPRVEREAPSMHRVDQALTNNVLANACSSFIVDWTWADGVGRISDSFGTVVHWGVRQFPSHEQAWFGLDPFLMRGVATFTQYLQLGAVPDPETITDAVIEPTTETQATLDIMNTNPGILVYEAIFGFNQSTPLNPATGLPWIPATGPAAYTPWPTSVRITMTLHDADLRLESGREVQFVINLPQRDG